MNNIDDHFKMKNEKINLQIPSRILLGAGPSMVHPRVLQAMAAPVIGHLDPTFLELMDRNQELLRYVFRTQNRLTLPISGTGTAAMEAAIANMVEPGDDILVCINGYFSQRMAEMARRYGGKVHELQRPWGTVFTPAEISQVLREQRFKYVCIVHAETSTGVLQPVDEITRQVHAQGGMIIVDAVTSLGGVPVEVDAWELDVCYSGSQKCLGCPPGLGPITFGPRAEEVLRSRKAKVPNWYLDINLLQRYWGEERIYHHTAPINANYALNEALQMIVEEGIEQRYARHEKNARFLWEGMQELNLVGFVPESNRLPSLTTILVPEGVDESLVRRRLINEFNIEIAGGLGEIKGKIWRVGLMGYSSSPDNVQLLLGALKQIFDSM